MLLSRHKADNQHKAETSNYSYDYYYVQRLRRLSFVVSGRLFRRERRGIDPVLLERLSRRETDGREEGTGWLPLGL